MRVGSRSLSCRGLPPQGFASLNLGGLIFDPFVFFAEPPCHVQLPTLMGNRIHSELDAAIAYRSMSLWHVTIPSQMLKHLGYFA